MAIKIEADEFSPITLNEFVDYLEYSQVIKRLADSLYDDSDMRSLATRLKSLAKNKDHLLDRITSELNIPERFQVSNNGQSQGFILYRAPDFTYTLRLMLWIPSGHQARPVPFSYEGAHDHAFDLMTVGFFGPGYRTSLYSFNYEDTIQHSDGLTQLNYLGDMYLKESDIIYYFANKDVHVQHPPESLSVSLNLIITKPDATVRQTVFDLEEPHDNDVVLGRARFNSPYKLGNQRSIFSILSSYGNERSLQAILEIARHHELDEVRALAWVALLCRSAPDPSWDNEIAGDRNIYIRKVISSYQADISENGKTL